MSSGSLPLGTYHRAQSIGSGAYGSVLTVYNDDGEEFALKLFDEDSDDEESSSDEEETDDDSSSEEYDKEDYKGMDLGALREISILRILRGANSHRNIVSIHDVQQPDGCDGDEPECGAGAGTFGYMAIAMPLYPHGTLSSAIDSSSDHQNGLLHSKRSKVAIAHGILSAVAYLHDNGIIHRDIKGDNILLDLVSDSHGTAYRPILIDFSLAKISEPDLIYGRTAPGNIASSLRSFSSRGETENTHTPSVGTPTYKAPEVVRNQPYGLASDMYSVGVVLLELLRGKTIESFKDRGAAKIVQQNLEALPDQPFANLVRGLLEVDPEQRLSARKALDSEVFRKFGFCGDGEAADGNRLGGRVIDVMDALPFDHYPQEVLEAATADSWTKENRCNGGNPLPLQKGKRGKNTKNSSKLSKRFSNIVKIAQDLECQHPLTTFAAMEYSIQLSQLEEDLDDMESQALVDCVILAQRFFEMETWGLRDLENRDGKWWKDWTAQEYKDNEATIWMLMDFCLYPRRLLDWSI